MALMADRVCPILSVGTIQVSEKGAKGFVPCIREKCELWNITRCGLRKSV